VEIDLPDTSDGRDVAALVERGDMDGMSFGFMVTHDEWDETSDPPKRTIHAVSLREVSAVTFPAYDDTTLALRTLEGAKEEARKAREEAEKRADSYFKRKAETEQKVRRL
jgi:phage head maturation protease